MKADTRIFMIRLWIVLAIVLVSSSVAQATILGSATFNPTLNKYVYSYTIVNPDPISEITSWFLDVSKITPDWTLTDIVTPAGWSASPPTGTQDFFSFSTLFGGSAVLPGGSLGGFSIKSALTPGSISYSETLFNPFTFGLNFATGTTTGPTPEPGTWLLLSLGLAGVAIYRRIRTRRAS